MLAAGRQVPHGTSLPHLGPGNQGDRGGPVRQADFRKTQPETLGASCDDNMLACNGAPFAEEAAEARGGERRGHERE